MSERRVSERRGALVGADGRKGVAPLRQVPPQVGGDACLLKRHLHGHGLCQDDRGSRLARAVATPAKVSGACEQHERKAAGERKHDAAAAATFVTAAADDAKAAHLDGEREADLEGGGDGCGGRLQEGVDGACGVGGWGSHEGDDEQRARRDEKADRVGIELRTGDRWGAATGGGFTVVRGRVVG
eukprot:7340061-Prymnesium_polylepis.1